METLKTLGAGMLVLSPFVLAWGALLYVAADLGPVAFAGAVLVILYTLGK